MTLDPALSEKSLVGEQDIFMIQLHGLGVEDS